MDLTKNNIKMNSTFYIWVPIYVDMRRAIIILLTLQIFQLSCRAQQDMDVELIMTAVGASDPDELDQEDLERLSAYLDAPISLNEASKDRLKHSGLFSSYQLASIEDYRARHGNIMSFAELSAIDGFSESIVKRIAPFIEVGGTLAPEKHRQREVVLRTFGRLSHQRGHCSSALMYGLKSRMDVSRHLSLALGFSRPYLSSGIYPEAFAGNISINFKRPCINLLIGDFNVRYGQGLAVWNGTSFSSLSAPSAFMRKPSGISPGYSFNGGSSMSGVASSYRNNILSVSLFLSFPGLKDAGRRLQIRDITPGLNVSCFGRSGHCSLTHVQDMVVIGDRLRIPEMKSSLDWAFCLRGINLYGEVMYDWVWRIMPFLAGLGFNIGDNVSNALRLKYAHDRSWTGAFSTEYLSADRLHNVMLAAESVLYDIGKSENADKSLQAKGILLWEYKSKGGFCVRLRLSERFRTWNEMFRTDLRADFEYRKASFHSRVRMNILECSDMGYMAFAEAGFMTGMFSVCLRQGIFAADSWEDRIYVSERDVPGAFNVPALYGRGEWTSLFASFKIRRIMKFYLRLSYFAFPFMPAEKRKPGKAELKFQLNVRF